MASLIVCFMAMAALLQLTSATKYEVGGSFGWNIPPNTTFYSEWASKISFFVLDELEFRSNSSNNWAEVETLSDYENCTNPSIVFLTLPPLSRILVKSGTYYFLSTIGCEAGQKFSINVSTLPGYIPPNSAPSLSYYGSVSALMVITAAIFSFNFY